MHNFYFTASFLKRTDGFGLACFQSSFSLIACRVARVDRGAYLCLVAAFKELLIVSPDNLFICSGAKEACPVNAWGEQCVILPTWSLVLTQKQHVQRRKAPLSLRGLYRSHNFIILYFDLREEPSWIDRSLFFRAVVVVSNSGR